MCTILILELYTANLAAYLTIPPAKSPIKNLEQLAASSDYKPLVKTGSNLDFLFRVNMLHLYYIDTTEHAMLEIFINIYFSISFILLLEGKRWAIQTNSRENGPDACDYNYRGRV